MRNSVTNSGQNVGPELTNEPKMEPGTTTASKVTGIQHFRITKNRTNEQMKN